jgi:hypothetical protein
MHFDDRGHHAFSNGSRSRGLHPFDLDPSDSFDPGIVSDYTFGSQLYHDVSLLWLLLWAFKAMDGVTSRMVLCLLSTGLEPAHLAALAFETNVSTIPPREHVVEGSLRTCKDPTEAF